MPNCYCLEFSFTKVSEYDLTYTNCSGNTVTETFQSGTTYSICSEDLNPISNCLDINFNVNGFCLDGVCTGEVYSYQNECNVITIFPLGVQCVTQNPTSISSFDGVATLHIMGGTPPYTIQWENGNYSQTLTNLGSGEYDAVVTDFYGDFTARTTCYLMAPSPTPTPTPTPTPSPTPVYGDLCLTILGNFENHIYSELIDFSYNGYYNGKPTWTSTPSGYDVVWMSGSSQWEVSGWTYGSLINTNTVAPPISGWYSLGSVPPNPVIGSVQMNEGSCVVQNNLNYTLTVNQPTCITNNTPGNCVSDGSIIFNVEDGVPPYSYSINGINFIPNQPVFQNLCPGIYPTIVMDASGQTFNQNITLNAPPAPILYTITLSLNVNATTFNVAVSPQLPIGASLSFDLVHEKNLTEQPQYGAYTWNNVVTVNKNMVSIPYDTTTNSGNTNLLNNLQCPTGVSIQSLNTYTWNGITIVQGDTVSGTISNPTPTLNLPILTKCLGVTNSYHLYLNDVTLNNCPCSTVTVINPPPHIGS
jgi:hypothetical protein